jgi:hypothetical protein
MVLRREFSVRAECFRRFVPLVLIFAGLAGRVGNVNAADLYQNITPFTITTTRELGAGGRHCAFLDGFSALWTNPAALYPVQQGSLFDFGLGANGDLPRLSAQLSGIADGTGISGQDIEKYAKHNLRNAPPLLSMRGPVAWGFIEKAFGIGVFNKFFVDSILTYTKINSASDEVLVRSNWNTDLVFNAAHSFTLFENDKRKLFWGAGIKVFFRNVLNLSSQTRQVISDKDRNYNQLDSSEKTIFGAGLSAGLFYMFNEKLSFGATIDDLLSGGGVNRAEAADGATGGSFFLFYPKFNFGASYIIKNTENFSWTLMADLRDILSAANVLTDETTSMLLGFSLGTELVFYQKLHLRFGLADALPSAGLSYNFEKFTLDFAFSGKNYDRKNTGYAAFGFDVGVKINV